MEKLTPIQLKQLERCVATAKKAGCPRDQVEGFIAKQYIPFPWQWEFHSVARQADLPDGPVDIGVGGARGPGKSHAVLSQAALDDCQRIPGLKGLFLRQTGVAAQESFDDLVSKVVAGHTAYKKTGQSLVFPNKSRILLGGFQDERDIDKYVGIEYDFIIVEELNQLTEDKYTKLRGSLRTSKPNWRPRMYTSFNPGGIGHQFVKDRYITPHRMGKETKTRFIGSTYKENPTLNKEYIEYLEDLKGELGRAWREGDFDIFAGQAFSEFNRNYHMISPPIIPSINFDHYFSCDWGYTDKKPHAFAAYLHAVIKMKTKDGQNFHRIITYKEWAGNQTTPDDWAEKIYKDCITMGITPAYGVVDSAMFTPSSDFGKPISKMFTDKWKELNGDRMWITLKKGTKDRIGRKAATHNWLSIAPDKLPYWMITENCQYLLDTLPQLITDEHRIEDVDCFVAGTKIKTIIGDMNVEDIQSGDLILTPIGYRRAYIVGDPKETQTTKVVLSNGKVLEGTSYHKVYVEGKGLVELKNLQCHDILMEWTTSSLINTNLLFTRILNIENITEGDIISRMEHILPKVLSRFINKYILIILVKFLMVFMYIIKTMVRIIMIFLILNLWRRENMLYYTTMRGLNQESFQISLKSGDRQKREGRRSVKMLIKCIKELLSGNFRVFIVDLLLKQNTKRKNFAINTKNIKGVKKSTVPFVEKYSGKEEEKEQRRPVVVSVEQNSGKKIVYRLRVEQSHLYYANGVLVTNTEGPDDPYDGATYFLYRVKFTKVKPGGINYGNKVELVQVQYNKEGQQIAFSPEEFANQYADNS